MKLIVHMIFLLTQNIKSELLMKLWRELKIILDNAKYKSKKI